MSGRPWGYSTSGADTYLWWQASTTFALDCGGSPLSIKDRKYPDGDTLPWELLAFLLIQAFTLLSSETSTAAAMNLYILRNGKPHRRSTTKMEVSQSES